MTSATHPPNPPEHFTHAPRAATSQRRARPGEATSRPARGSSLTTAWGRLLEPDTLSGILTSALPGLVGAWTGPRFETLVDEATRESGTPWPSPQASDYARFFHEGVRTAHEDLVRGRQARLTRAVVRVVSAPDGDRSPLVDDVADGVLLLCEQSSWCWVAHDATPRRSGTVVPPTRPWLDLGAGEIAAQLAWMDRLVGTEIDVSYPGLRERVRSEAVRRVLDPFLDREWPWLTGEVNNWCPWMCGNVLAAAIQLLPPGERRTATVLKAIDGLDRYLAGIPADGSVDEGYGYWWEGVGRALEALDVLERVTSGRLSAGDLPAIRATIAFPHRMHLGGPWHVNVADASSKPRPNVPWDVLLRWARRVGDGDAERYALNRWSQAELTAEWPMNLARVVGGLEAQSDAGTTVEPPLVSQAWLPDVQIGLVRERPGRAEGLAAVLKGGHNAESHNHNDVGSVIVASDGVPVLVDPGRLTYSAGMFGPERYEFWAMQSRWHNVPVVAGHEQAPGSDRRARGFSRSQDGDMVTMSLDLADAYPHAGLEHWTRSVTLSREEGSCVIEDQWSFAQHPDVESTAHYVLAGQLTRVGPTEFEIAPVEAAHAVRLEWTGDVTAVELTERRLNDPAMTDVWGQRLTRLELHLAPQRAGAVRLIITRLEHSVGGTLFTKGVLRS